MFTGRGHLGLGFVICYILKFLMFMRVSFAHEFHLSKLSSDRIALDDLAIEKLVFHYLASIRLKQTVS